MSKGGERFVVMQVCPSSKKGEIVAD